MLGPGLVLKTASPKPKARGAKSGGLGLRHGFTQADDLVTGLELTALFQEFHAFKPLQNVALDGDGAGAFQAAMLGHKIGRIRAGKYSLLQCPV